MINEIKIHALMDNSIDSSTKESQSISSELKFFARDKLIARGKLAWSYMPYKRYKRLRNLGRRKQFSPKDSLPPLPDQVNWKVQQERRSIKPLNSSVLAISSNRTKTVYEATLVVDEQNLFFFDHYCDHVPGILLFQGFNELASRYCADLTPNYVTQAELDFSKFAELNYPVKLSVVDCNSISPLNSSIQLQATQNNHLLAQGTLRVSNLEARNE